MLVRQCDLAREFGVTSAAILRAVRAGRLAHAAGHAKLFDLDAARQAWTSNRRRKAKVANTSSTRSTTAKAPAAESAPPASAPRDTDTAKLVRTRLRREKIDAELAELKLAEARGTLVRKDAVRREQFERFRMLRNRVMGIADRVAPVLAAERDPAKVHAILTAEIRNALDAEVGVGANGKSHPKVG